MSPNINHLCRELVALYICWCLSENVDEYKENQLSRMCVTSATVGFVNPENIRLGKVLKLIYEDYRLEKKDLYSGCVGGRGEGVCVCLMLFIILAMISIELLVHPR